MLCLKSIVAEIQLFQATALLGLQGILRDWVKLFNCFISVSICTHLATCEKWIVPPKWSPGRNMVQHLSLWFQLPFSKTCPYTMRVLEIKWLSTYPIASSKFSWQPASFLSQTFRQSMVQSSIHTLFACLLSLLNAVILIFLSGGFSGSSQRFVYKSSF